MTEDLFKGTIYKRAPFKLHLEPTKDCNARCPQCIRTLFNTMESLPNIVPQTEIDPRWLHKMFKEDDLFKQFSYVLINGNAGDIIMHSNPKQLLRVLINQKNIKWIQINTNGGGLTTDFWKWCASIPNLIIEFAVDGLEDTHHLYRRNTRFKTVMRNIDTFISNGGRAHVSTNINGNNKHQWDDIVKLFKQYNLMPHERYNTRFEEDFERCYDKDFKEEYKLYSAETLGKRKHSIPKTPAELKKLKKKLSKKFPAVVNREGSWTHDPYWAIPVGSDPLKITCKVNGDYEDVSPNIFLSAEGRLFPCCWTEVDYMSQIYLGDGSSIINAFKSFQENPYWNSLYHYTSKEVLAGDMFTELKDMWEDSSCPKMCRKKCSKFNPHRET